MSEHFELPYGRIMESEGLVKYEIPKTETNLIDPEQLEELKREKTLFFSCQHYQVKEDVVTIFYKKKPGYVSLPNIETMNDQQKRKMVDSLLQIEDLVGTQFSTFLHPANIYVNNQGDVNFAHRGIRSVLPPEEFSDQGLLHDLKPLLLSLYSNHSFAELVEDKQNSLLGNDPFLQSIFTARSVEQLSKLFDKKSNAVASTPTKPKQPTTNQVTEKKTQSKKVKLSTMSGVLIGVLIGIIGLYLIKVVPMTESASAFETEQGEKEQVLTEENQELQKELDESQLILKGYQEATAGNTEAAIANFEKVKTLEKSDEQTLVRQYITLNTVDSLTKAASIDESYHPEVVEKLAEFDNENAREAILSLSSNTPEVLIEQAWLNKDYKAVLDLYKQIPDNKHAKLLAANSHIEFENNKQAMKLGKELKNKQIQIESLQIEKKKIEDNEDLDKEEREERLDKLNEEIEKLKN
ncbi:type VII secretion protein EssB/YukC [Oceanobacillus kapialis]|uniref:type VII secretion protein EssB/YukC n=1 Tax=Oceanobacillus kapialis TaxID=481353 RepID=UPI00385141BD